MTTRRSFLQSILAAGVAPAFIGSNILMPVKALVLPEYESWIYTGHHDWEAAGLMSIKDSGSMTFFDNGKGIVALTLDKFSREVKREYRQYNEAKSF